MAYRWLDKLTDNFRKKVEWFLKEVWDDIFITETWRSQERQDQLYAQGRTIYWNIVTRTRYSLHQQWKAIDIAFRWGVLYPSDINKWQHIYNIAHKYWITNLRETERLEKPHLQDDWSDYKKLTPKEEEEKRNDIIKQMNINSVMYNRVNDIKLKKFMSWMNDRYRKLWFFN